MHIRIKYGKNKIGKFISHLDLARAWERTFRRAGIPIAYSQGFNPHPRISFGSALAVGVTSTGEYLDIVLKNDFLLKEMKERLENYLPRGIEIIDLVEINAKAPSLMSIINRARYLVGAEVSEPIDEDYLQNMIKQLLDQQEVIVLRETKKGLKERDIRAGIYGIKGKVIEGKKVQLDLLLQTGSKGNVRPEEILQPLKDKGISFEQEVISIHREGLYVSDGEKLISPLSVTS